MLSFGHCIIFKFFHAGEIVISGIGTSCMRFRVTFTHQSPKEAGSPSSNDIFSYSSSLSSDHTTLKTMGSTSSKFESDMPRLPLMEPMGILSNYTTRTQPIRLEFAKGKGRSSLIKEAGTNVVIFEVEGMNWGKTQLRQGRAANNTKGKVLFNIYAQTFTWKWNVKGDNIQRDQVKVKPLLFQVKCDTRRKPVFEIKFTKEGKEIVWHIRQDEVRPLVKLREIFLLQLNPCLSFKRSSKVH